MLFLVVTAAIGRVLDCRCCGLMISTMTLLLSERSSESLNARLRCALDRVLDNHSAELGDLGAIAVALCVNGLVAKFELYSPANVRPSAKAAVRFKNFESSCYRFARVASSR